MRSARVLVASGLLAGAWVVAAACGGVVDKSGISTCPEGTEGCPCYGNGTCDDGLRCTSGLCVMASSQPTGGSGGTADDASVGGTGATGGSGGTGGGGNGGTADGIGGGPNLRCEPGEVSGCYGPSGCAGTRVCSSDGTWGSCECGPAPMGGTGGVAGCVPGQFEPCVGPGNCPGLQVCTPGQIWGPCECTPGPWLGTGGVEVVCFPGERQPCRDPGNCVGVRLCTPDLTGFGPCECGAGGSGGDPTGPSLPMDATGWVARDSNPWGIQGPWYWYSDAATGGNTVLPNAVMGIPPYDPSRGAMCLTGTTPGGSADNFTTWGAGIGLNVNQEEGSGLSPPLINSTIRGFDITITGRGPDEILAKFLPSNPMPPGDEAPSISLMPGTNHVLVSSAVTPAWAPNAGQVGDPNRIAAVQIQASAGMNGGLIDFCVTALNPF